MPSGRSTLQRQCGGAVREGAAGAWNKGSGWSSVGEVDRRDREHDGEDHDEGPQEIKGKEPAALQRLPSRPAASLPVHQNCLIPTIAAMTPATPAAASQSQSVGFRFRRRRFLPPLRVPRTAERRYPRTGGDQTS